MGWLNKTKLVHLAQSHVKYLIFDLQHCSVAYSYKHHLDLSEKQDSCGNHSEEAKYDEYDDQVG